MSKTVDLKALTPEQKAQLMAELQAEEQAKKELQKEARALYEQEEDLTVCELIEEAEGYREALQSFKNFVFDKLEGLLKMIKESDGDGGRQSKTFKSADGTMKIEFSRQRLGEYDARSDEAVALISEFVTERFAEDKETQELVMSLLENKNGGLDPKLVQKLYKMESKFEHPKWKRGLELLRESYRLGDTKTYVRFFKQGAGNAWQGIKLDFAVLPVYPLLTETVEADEVETEEGGADDASL